jgi:predicted RNA-binding protein YlxR (DUF448 family)
MTAAATMTRRPKGGPDGPDGLDSSNGEAPLRRCIVTRESQPKDELIRFVVAPDGTLTPDLAETLPGRGIWVSASRDAIETARAKKLFGRAARRAVTVPEDLAERLERMLAERCVALLGLLNRAGELVAGMMRVREWLRDGKAAILLTAADSDGRDATELKRLARGMQSVDVLKGVELGRAVGRDHIVHMAAAPGRLAQSLLRETRRLAGLRDGSAR